jgi:hypothetical protein
MFTLLAATDHVQHADATNRRKTIRSPIIVTDTWKVLALCALCSAPEIRRSWRPAPSAIPAFIVLKV